jgi:hypothetical protein
VSSDSDDPMLLDADLVIYGRQNIK